jgi:formylglycine-generating enzyme required for sulfatase activity
MRNKSILVLAMVRVMVVMNVASADIVQGINMDFVTIGHAGNPGDTRAEASPPGCGAVGYEYRIGKYEVTNAQWGAFQTGWQRVFALRQRIEYDIRSGQRLELLRRCVR